MKCRVCRSLINSGEPHVFRKGWWYCWRHVPELVAEVKRLYTENRRLVEQLDGRK